MTESNAVNEKGASEIPLYIDSSALAKLYVPDVDSDRPDAFLRGKVGLMISELALRIRDAVLADAGSGSFVRLHLHRAPAFSGVATHALTFDRRMREAALQSGLNVIDL